MRNIFTTFATSRFVDAEAVRDVLADVARRLVAATAGVKAVWLFGSFAAGTATPRSDADVVIEIEESEFKDRERFRIAAMRMFADAPVPVDLFVMTAEELQRGGGIAAVVRREGLLLA